MNKGIKIIDLLNMIAERKELPEKIKYRDIEYERSYIATRNMYYYASENSNLLMEQLINTIDLLSTVEIIEEDNNKIVHYDMFDYFSGYEYGGTDKKLLQDLQTNFEIINKELKYLIDKINNI